MRITLAADHAGFPLKQFLLKQLDGTSHNLLDLGTNNADPVDYPDFAEAAAKSISTEQADRAIIICGSGVGASVVANKLPGVRAGLCHDTYSACQGVEHDDMNVLCLGSRVIGDKLALALVRAFLGASFSKEKRHLQRLDKIESIERKYRRAP